ncbi:MAG: NAD(P)/FAD-dependent oxidoreductase [Patescibacteria group bacterium]
MPVAQVFRYNSVVNEYKKNILILGAGFAGMRTALSLSSRVCLLKKYKIILIDEQTTHLYTPDLYEIATAYTPQDTPACATMLRDTVAVSISRIIGKQPIEFIHDKVVQIRHDSKTVELEKGGSVSYDYLVVALGGVVNYYDIQGLEEHALRLKSVSDALAIQSRIDSHIRKLASGAQKPDIVIIVCGGGATGVDLIGELPSYADILCKKYGYPREKVHISIIEAGNELVRLGRSFSKHVEKRLKKLGVKIIFNTRVIEVRSSCATVKMPDGKRQDIPADIIVWTGGIKPSPVINKSFDKTTPLGALEVNEFLEAKYFKHIFAGGDSACFIDPVTGQTAPWLAQVAVQHGDVIAKNIAATICGCRKRGYRLRLKGIIIPVGGHFAIFKSGPIIFSGFIPWVMRRLIDLWYAMTILPPWYAMKKWWHNTNVFTQNDNI